jgi:hypothetical protein
VVTRQKGHRSTFERPDTICIRWLPKRRVHLAFVHLNKAFHLVKAASTDYSILMSFAMFDELQKDAVSA